VKITQITVSWGETQSLPEYCNTKPSLTLTATLDDGDDPTAAELLLWQQARDAVRAQIDAVLERNNLAAKYDPCPRYQVMRSMRPDYYRKKQVPEEEWPNVVLILPDTDAHPKGYVHTLYPDSRNLRYPYALKKAQEKAQKDGATLINCADGDLTKIPPMPGSDEDNPF